MIPTMEVIREMNLSDLFKSISAAFAGKYQTESKEVQEMRNEVFNLDIPSCMEDKENLSQDSRTAVNDLKKAYEEYRKNHDIQ